MNPIYYIIIAIIIIPLIWIIYQLVRHPNEGLKPLLHLWYWLLLYAIALIIAVAKAIARILKSIAR